MILELGCYQIRPNNPGLSLWKHEPGGGIVSRGRHKGCTIKEGWKPMNQFPHNFAHALHLIAEDYVANGGGKNNYKDALVATSAYIDSISAAAKRLEDAISESE